MALAETVILLKAGFIKVLPVLYVGSNVVGLIFIIVSFLRWLKFIKSVTPPENGHMSYVFQVLTGVLFFSLAAFIDWAGNSMGVDAASSALP